MPFVLTVGAITIIDHRSRETESLDAQRAHLLEGAKRATLFICNSGEKAAFEFHPTERYIPKVARFCERALGQTRVSKKHSAND